MRKKIISCILIIMILFSTCSTLIASAATTAYIQAIGEATPHLKYNDKYVKISVVGHYSNGIFYPAYCMNKDLNGAETGAYNVIINQVLNNDAVWRVIKNGFPYKSAAEMGLQTDFDAFAVTKMAIYCILGQSNLANFSADSNDGTAQAMLSALHNLVNIGVNGGETQNSGSFSVNKVGEFTETGDYYVQIFSPNSSTGMSNYTITSIDNFPSGSYIANMNGTAQNTFGSTEQFKIMIPKNQLGSDINGNIHLSGICKTYPIFYGETTIAGNQNYIVTSDPYGSSNNTVVNLNIKTNTGKIQIHKIDDETFQPIEGVTFQLLKSDGTVIANATTDRNGNASFSKLYQNSYILKEVATNEKYILNTEEFNVNVNYNKTTNITIENEHKKGNIKVYKVDKDYNKVVLGNVKFDLFSEEFGRVIGTYHTDVNGEIYIPNLRIGNYSLIEKETNRWYNLADDTEIKVEWDLTTDTTIENELKKGQIKIVKVDLDDNEVKLQGVKFEIYNENNELLEILITDENGEALSSKYPVRDFEKLIVKEVETLENYVLNDTPQTIVLEANKITNVQFENEKIKGYIEITKVTEDDSKHTGLLANSPLEGVTFEIYDNENNLVQTLITDKNGKATTDLLLRGDYFVKELDTGSKYYLLNENKYKVTIKNHHETEPVTITNKSVDISVDVNKSGYVETQKNDIIKYDFSNIANTSNIYLDSFRWKDYLPTDYIRLTEIVTGTWNQEITYSITYKTNMNNQERILKENLNSKENYKIDCTSIGLQEGEYITEYCFNFGKVDIGFKEEIAPSIFCKVLGTVKDKDIFTNKTETVGEYEDLKDEKYSEWTTIVYEKDVKGNVLPKTGK